MEFANLLGLSNAFTNAGNTNSVLGADRDRFHRANSRTIQSNRDHPEIVLGISKKKRQSTPKKPKQQPEESHEYFSEQNQLEMAPRSLEKK